MAAKVSEFREILHPEASSTRAQIPQAQTPAGGSELFEQRPIRMEGFALRSRSVEITGRPTLEQWSAAFAFAAAAERASPYWVGDLLAFAESRQDWRKRLDQAISLGAGNYSDQTLHNLTRISRSVRGKARDLAPTIGHAEAVASLHPEEQVEWLEKASTEGWTRQHLRAKVKDRLRFKGAPATAAGKYRVIYVDPPWSAMPIEALCRLPVPDYADANCVLFLWVPPALMLSRPGAIEVLGAWGFAYKASGIWDGVLGTQGSHLALVHENLVIATRGNCLPDTTDLLPGSVFRERRSAEDFTRKPSSIRRQWIERLYPTGPYLELFGRNAVEGWTVLGPDPRNWGAAPTGKRAAMQGAPKQACVRNHHAGSSAKS